MPDLLHFPGTLAPAYRLSAFTPEGPRMLQSPRPDLADARPGFREFVVLIAGLMSLNALAIDAMVPALPAIGRALGVADENSRQLVVSLYVLGFGFTQIIYGP